MTQELIQQRYQRAQKFAIEAGKLTLKYFQTDQFQVERKGDQSPVTIADREAEQLLRTLIEAEFPTDAIVGEEFSEKPGESGFKWIVDPIDGTKSFISGVPLYGTMIGIEYRGECVSGVVYLPGLDEGIHASTGQGAWHFKGDKEPVAASVSKRTLSQGVFVTSEVKTFAKRNAKDVYAALQEKSYVTRSWGDCYGYLLVATGRVELMVDPMLSVWDAAAVKPIIEEAGGVFVDWKGKSTIHSGDAIGCNPAVLEEVLAITKQAKN